MNRNIILLVMIILFACGCKHKQTLKEKKKLVRIGNLSDKNVYSSEEVGWTIQVISDWDVMINKESEKIMNTGKDIVKENIGMKLNTSGINELIMIKKDAFNFFLSYIQPFNDNMGISFEQKLKNSYALIKSTLRKQNLYVECKEGKEDIDGLSFYTLYVSLFSADKTRVILYEKVYGRLVNGYDFTILAGFNNQENEELLKSMIKSSRLSIRE